MSFVLITPQTGEHLIYTNTKIVNFLHQHLDEFGDKKEDILNCLLYAQNPDKGGFILLKTENEQIIGATVINRTGMKGYIPSNILVYIAVHKNYRGKGIGKQLMLEALPKTTGGVALHVEPENPAKFLYQKLGFTHKYLEMRFEPKN